MQNSFSDENAQASTSESTSPQFLNIPTMEGYQYPVDDMLPLHELLTNWGLEFLFQTLLGKYLLNFYFLHEETRKYKIKTSLCLDEFICMKGITVMEANQAYELLKHFPLGIRLLFVYNLKKWQKTQENDITSTSTPPINLQTSTNQPIQHHHQNSITLAVILHLN